MLNYTIYIFQAKRRKFIKDHRNKAIGKEIVILKRTDGQTYFSVNGQIDSYKRFAPEKIELKYNRKVLLIELIMGHS